MVCLENGDVEKSALPYPANPIGWIRPSVNLIISLLQGAQFWVSLVIEYPMHLGSLPQEIRFVAPSLLQALGLSPLEIVVED